jgi:protein-tyrosine phosphatase
MGFLTAFRGTPVLDASAITDKLYIAARPRRNHVSGVRELNIDLLISMIWFRPVSELMRPPFKVVRLPTMDNPLFPLPLWMLRRGVEAALPVMSEGGRVLVYCRAGRHRSVAMACCILIGLGMTAEDAMRLVIERRPVADPHAPHIERRIRAFEQDWLGRVRAETTVAS